MFRTGDRPTGKKLNSIKSAPIGMVEDYITQTPTNVAVVKGDVVVAPNFTYKNRFN